MSQMPSQTCPQCRIQVEAGNRFCPNCGSTISQPIGPTAAASSPSNIIDPTVAASGSPSNINNLPYGSPPPGPIYNAYPPSPSNPGFPGVVPPQPVPHTQYSSGMIPPPAPIDPYSSSTPIYPTPRKKRSLLLPIIIAVAAVVVIIAGTGTYLLFKNNGGGGGIIPGTNPSYSSSQDVNLTVTYSNDKITFNKIEQAAKFSDDSQTQYTYTNTKDYIRLSFREEQTGKSGSYFSYSGSSGAFHLKLADGTSVNGLKSQQLLGPGQGEARANWVDFPSTNGLVDISKLTLTLGASDENQETFQLKTGADVTKYNPKNAAPISPFKYAGIDMTVTSATQAYYDDGKQAKTNKVYITVALKGDNNNSNLEADLGFDFLKIKTADETDNPELGSNMYDFAFMNTGKTNVTGTASFLVTVASNGQYTLVFQKGQNFDEVDQQLSFS